MPTIDPLLGFLPPNKIAPEGEGGIYFNINAKSNLPSETIVNNKASIYFDANAPIVTNNWSIRLDKNAPSSRIKALPEKTTDTIINLSWSGSDNESGIEKYDIYYSQNGSAYMPLLTRTSLNKISFVGKQDSTYAFYSIAIDSVGNKEQKTSDDTKTTITFSSEDASIYPNPAKGTFTLKVIAQPTDITLFNVQGRRIPISITTLNNNQYKVALKSGVSFGVYILKIQTANKLICKKIILQN